MKLLFVLRHPAAVRSLHGVFRLLVERGHDVHLGFGAAKSGDAHRVLQQIAIESPGLTFDKLPRSGRSAIGLEGMGWKRLANDLRLSADSLRYLDPRYDEATGLRARGAAKAPPAARRFGRLASKAGQPGVRTASAVVRALERSLEPPAYVKSFVAGLAPDAVVATHLNEWGSPQADYVRAAKRLGIPTAYLVFSWDNLTNKGLVRDVPDLTLVWNDLQKAEAVELQRLPADRIRVTGAPAYDHWFEWTPGTTREEFAAAAGLDPAQPYVLYACSASFVAQEEVAFIRRWIEAVRARMPEVGILVRPHPRNMAQWRDVALDAAVWPPHGEEPVEAESRGHYFDSIYHSAAVVGINTSTQIEAAIVGRPVHTILADEFRATQRGTLHFHYLCDPEFGCLVVARSLDEHAAQLEESVAGRTGNELNERFLRRFVRPLGLDVPATPVVAAAIEEVAVRRVAAERGPLLGPAVRAGLTPFARRAARRDARAQAPDRKRRREAPSLARALRHEIRALVDAGGPIVAAPWEDDEVGELLFWVPFLSWAETTVPGLRERMTVVARPQSAAWYAGIGTRVVTEAPAGARLEPELIAAHRDELPTRHQGFYSRLTKFARLTLAEPPPELAGGEYRGPYGPLAFVAILLGLPAYVTGEPDVHAEIAERYLKPPTYGRLTFVATESPAAPGT